MATTLEAQRVTIATPASTSRLVSLDVFRGITIAAMILVNNAGDWSHVYWPLEHAEWHGWTPTDLIFPFFLFIVGVSMVLSFESRRAKGASSRELLLHSLKRSAIIFALGLFLSGYPNYDLHTIRILGVLQRIAVVYLLTSAIVLYSGRRARIVIAATLLLGYWAVMKLIPVPAFAAGVLTQDGNLAAVIDRAIMYNHLYVVHRYDPEGVLSTFPAIATCLLGVFTGEWIRGRSSQQVVRGLLMGAAAAIALGKVWNVWFPINKNLWTSSFVLFTAGCALALFTLCYWLVDVRGWKKWATPFVLYGMNPLGIYFLASWLSKMSVKHTFNGVQWKAIVYDNLFVHLSANPYLNSMAFGLCYMVLFLIVAWALYRKRIFIRV